MRAIFISYRREDTEGHAGRLFRDLCERFGNDAVFMDVAGIEPGRDFRRVIEQQVASCGVLLAVIGKDWLTTKDEEGHRRLDDPIDFVRIETASALKRNIPVIPVLVHGARMPRPEQLPEDLRELAYRNSVELTHARWESDVQLLMKALLPHVDEAPAGSRAQTPMPAAPTSRRSRTAAAASGLVIALAVGGYVVFSMEAQPPPTRPAADDIVVQKKLEPEPTPKSVEPERVLPEAGRNAPPATQPTAKTARVEAEKARAAPDPVARTRTVEPMLEIGGIWRDVNYSNNSSQITQDGASFRFTRRGVLPNGTAFEAAGAGKIIGQRYASSYAARYGTGDMSKGDCSGTVSPDALRMELNCRDSLLGIFALSAVRQ